MTHGLFCFGLGYSALALIERLARQGGWRFAGTARSAEKAAALAEEGVEALVFDAADGPPDPRSAAFALDGATHLLISAPPGADGDPVLRHWRASIARAANGLKWIGYLSTTGVYGDRGGDWVDEESRLSPTGARGQRRATAEAGWRALGEESGVPVHIFRLAGIYGPGRSAFDSLKAGTARRIVKPGQVFSRIHVEDIATILVASVSKAGPGEVYNVCDDEAAPPQDVIAYAAELMGVAPPPEIPFDQAELSPMAQSFYRDNKRVRNDKIKQALGVALAYPTYREGLRALLPST